MFFSVYSVAMRRRIMAKPTGFMEYERELPADRAPQERIQDWQEFHLQFPDDKLVVQAARCMDWASVFIPANLNGMAWDVDQQSIPEWNHLVYKGLWQRLERLLQTSPSGYRAGLPGSV
jgi:glutamate synthase (NADPH/NADH) small chain